MQRKCNVCCAYIDFIRFWVNGCESLHATGWCVYVTPFLTLDSFPFCITHLIGAGWYAIFGSLLTPFNKKYAFLLCCNINRIASLLTRVTLNIMCTCQCANVQTSTSVKLKIVGFRMVRSHSRFGLFFLFIFFLYVRTKMAYSHTQKYTLFLRAINAKYQIC